MTEPPRGGPTGSPAGQPGTPIPSGPGAAVPPVPRQDPSAIPSPPAPYPPYQDAQPPKRKRGVVIASVALAAILLLCAGGGVVTFLTLRNAEEGEGAKEPTAAVEQFLTAVYKDRDAARAAKLVCADSRDDEKVAAKIAEVETYVSGNQNPRFRWSNPKVDNQTGDRATVSTRLTVTTADEKIADQQLRFTVVKKTGWWVCEVA
ncbi:Rv0361 family membrane protein [Micromonospora sp. BQ11]|uniref:Rv0361 family membrane protein n=1 Tax=Micromonospora sp. BQ11 TaxID=3452212 RepID=UPI003F8CDB5F